MQCSDPKTGISRSRREGCAWLDYHSTKDFLFPLPCVRILHHVRSSSLVPLRGSPSWPHPMPWILCWHRWILHSSPIARHRRRFQESRDSERVRCLVVSPSLLRCCV